MRLVEVAIEVIKHQRTDICDLGQTGSDFFGDLRVQANDPARHARGRRHVAYVEFQEVRSLEWVSDAVTEQHVRHALRNRSVEVGIHRHRLKSILPWFRPQVLRLGSAQRSGGQITVFPSARLINSASASICARRPLPSRTTLRMFASRSVRAIGPQMRVVLTAETASSCSHGRLCVKHAAPIVYTRILVLRTHYTSIATAAHVGTDPSESRTDRGMWQSRQPRMVTPSGLEPEITPREGAVLTARPWGRCQGATSEAGSGIRIRTLIARSRVWRPAVRRSPNMFSAGCPLRG